MVLDSEIRLMGTAGPALLLIIVAIQKKGRISAVNLRSSTQRPRVDPAFSSAIRGPAGA